ncbi:MAG: VOC family protein [Gammaproteobacteria bacterium]|nr:VOC family protein [Gammaproteobacteria bacterium]
MIDHIGINVSDYDKSVNFYQQALEPLGYTMLMEIQGWTGFGAQAPKFWLTKAEPVTTEIHIAFQSPDRASVDAFYRAAIEAGGADNGAPGIRDIYHPNYYGAFVIDPDGNNIEAVCHKPE